MSLQKLLKLYDYKVPTDLIAQKPALPRDSAKLLVYKKDTKQISYDRFYNLTKYLPKSAVLVFNETKVIPARFIVKKLTGGIAKLLFVKKTGDCWEILSNTKLNLGSKVYLVKNKKFKFLVKSKKDGHYFIKPIHMEDIYGFLEKYGQTPVPPYIKHSPLSEKQLRENYQAIFAKEKGSIAAPTASLHFTKNLLNKIEKSGIAVKFITLHVNLGTFAPLTEENLKTNRLHQEYYEIDKNIADFLNKAKKQRRPIIAVGTTVARTLESASDKNGVLKKLQNNTDLFITEEYRLKFVDGIITNFHVPKSSLMMLISAFISRKKLLELYRLAIKRRFRFFSFGDGMLVCPVTRKIIHSSESRHSERGNGVY